MACSGWALLVRVDAHVLLWGVFMVKGSVRMMLADATELPECDSASSSYLRASLHWLSYGCISALLMYPNVAAIAPGEKIPGEPGLGQSEERDLQHLQPGLCCAAAALHCLPPGDPASPPTDPSFLACSVLWVLRSCCSMRGL